MICLEFKGNSLVLFKFVVVLINMLFGMFIETDLIFGYGSAVTGLKLSKIVVFWQFCCEFDIFLTRFSSWASFYRPLSGSHL